LRALVVSLLTALAVLAGLLAPPASAAPRQPDDRVTPQRTQPVSYKHQATVSKSQMAGLRIAKDVANKDSKGKTLDYKKAAKRWGKHTIYRRQFAGAWLATGGKIKNIGKSEFNRVKKYRLKAKATRATGMVSARSGTNCTGSTSYFWAPHKGINFYYFDSCRTNDFKANLTFCMTGAGFAAALLRNEGVAVVMAILLAGCAAATNWISKAQSNSRVNAILILTRRGYDYDTGRYVAPVEIKPQ
jgi:hypothetical protein